MPDRKEMSDKNLREVLSMAIRCNPSEVGETWVEAIHAAIAKDREEERLFCKEQVKAKMKDNVQNFGGGK